MRTDHLPGLTRFLVLALAIGNAPQSFAQGGYVGSEVTAQDVQNHMGQNIDTGHDVGATAGMADVSDIGSAGYTLPLYVAPGTNGMQPVLSVNYSSLGGDGPLGYGWSIGGFSAISRTGLDQYHDNAVWPTTLNSNADRFTLDGQRLMVTSGTDYFAPDASYDTESAQFNYCVAQGQQGFGPASFRRVVKESGWSYEYGGGTPAQYAQVMVGGSSSVFMWLLNKVEDAFGNYMTFTYNQSSLQPRLERIDYTANANTGLASYNAVVYEYVDRTDVNEVFIKSTPGIKTAKLLKQVTMYAVGAAFKQYQFNYCLRDHGKSFLRELVEVGADMTTTLNSTLVKYGELVTENYEYSVTNASIGEDRKLYAGDFDGDGSSEVLAVRYHEYSD